ncbi:MAG: DNA polymerase III subunit delta' [Geodermatophilaceae bacterium]
MTSCWDEVVGQPETVAVLRRAAGAAAAIVNGAADPDRAAMSHSWLFTGPPGSGRSVAARAFAAALQCPNGGCGACPQCHTVQAGTHADVHVVLPEGLSIPVKDVRALVRTAARRPAAGRWQVVIVEDADRLTEGAANALLKAVEEPPERTVFLLCAPSTHPDDVSVTLRSRCRSIALRVPDDAAVAEVLVRRDGVDPAQAAWAAGAAQGHVGRARWLARDEQARIRRSAVLDIPLSLRTLADCFAAADELVGGAEEEAAARAAERDGPETEALKVALGAGGTGKGAALATRGSAAQLKDLERRQRSRATRSQRDSLDRALVDLAGFYRDVLTAQSGSGSTLWHADRETDVRRMARGLSAEGALRRLEAVLAAREAVELNVKPRVAVEAMAVALRLP